MNPWPQRLKIAGLLALVFLAGASVGVVTTRVATRHAFRRSLTEPDYLRQRIAADLSHRLDLDAVQQARLDAILRATLRELADIRREGEPRVTAAWTRAHDEFAAALTPEQRAKFEQVSRENRALWQP